MFSQPPEKPIHTPRRPLRLSVRYGFVIVFFVIGIFGIVLLGDKGPALAANLANPLRSLIGNRGVARLESLLFTVQDQIQQWEYQSGRKEAAAPWDVEENNRPTAVFAAPSPTWQGNIVPSGTSQTIEKKDFSTRLPNRTDPTATKKASASEDETPEPILRSLTSATPAPTATEWLPEPVPPFASVEGEGVWLPYIENAAGRTVAARTFLQPDPERPFAYIAVVAFDLTAVRLNYVIGFDEPSEKGGPKGTGVIPSEHFQADVLLAAFNGGFQSTHGGYGAMENGFVPLPPKDEAATVAIYLDGTVQIGEWGKDIRLTSDLIAYRQNCRMIVHNGEISPRVFNNSTVDWGGTIDNQIVTWRSGLGISEDGKTLYYFVGPGLSMPALASGMLAAGAYQSMLLDINAFWVHFVAIARDEEGRLISEPLLPDAMRNNVERFLSPFPRDFFYIISVYS